MKKTFLSIVAMGFGVSVAFAQTAPAETGAPVQQEQTTEAVAQDEQNRTKVELSTLPLATKLAFQNGQYGEMEVIGVYEVTAEENAEAIVYEFELVEATENAEATEIAGVEIEKVSERQPDVVLHIDENGQLIKEDDLDKEEGQ